MAIRYHCPNCGRLLSIGSRRAGQQTKCPACADEHVVPLADEVPSPKAASPRPASPRATPPGATSPRAAALRAVDPTQAPPPAEGPIKQSPAPAGPLPEGPSFPISYAVDPLDDDDDEEALVMGKIERKSDELDLIPMVDCVFLLLVFYMITASYALQKTIEMGKPAAEKKGALQAVQSTDDATKSSVVVQIDAQNRISVDDIPLASASGLADVLRAKMSGDQKNELVVEADPRAFHETIVAVVDAAHELQFQHVRMAITASEGD